MSLTGLIIASIVGSVVSSVIGATATGLSQNSANATNKEINNTNNAFNAEEAQKTRDWQTQMSNTTYQRQIADMKAAGLNPGLMLANGSTGQGVSAGATAHSGNFAGAYGANYNSLGSNLGQLVNSAAKVQALKNMDLRSVKDIYMATGNKTSASQVSRINEAISHTKPMSDKEWSKMLDSLDVLKKAEDPLAMPF